MRSSTASVMASALTLAIAPAALAAPVVPDATFTGTVNGVITGGQTTNSVGIGEYYQTMTIPLSGSRISIDFTAAVTYDYVDEADDGRLYPRYVINAVSLTITPIAPLGIYESTQTNDYAFYWGSADYVGNAMDGAFSIGGAVGGEPDFQQSVTFAFSGARSTLAALTGSGSATTHFFNPYGTSEQDAGRTIDSSFTFDLTGGFATGPGQTAAAPEPATWSMMIAGMGVIGGAMRRTRRQPAFA